MNSNTQTIEKNGRTIVIVHEDAVVIKDVNSALDFMMSIRYDTDCDGIVLNKAAITEEFFDLSSRLAGDILQKFVTYQVQLAIVGDFCAYTSKALQDFIYESNQGRHIFFMPSVEDAMEKLIMLK